ncbi:MAG: hypothetical protein KBD62_36540 [Kofleriaceae bacterium]|nr:hypothetical protein [Kofleriaceae bacterium]
MGAPRKTDAELAASGSANLSRRRAEEKRAREQAALRKANPKDADVIGPPLPETDAEWKALIRSLPGFDPYHLAAGCSFRPDLALKAILWIQANVRHLKGPRAGQPFILERWQRSFVANLFGWVRDRDGLRRFREALLYVAKKNGKALDEDTPIPTPDGWKSMGELVAGDAVFDERGVPCRVVAVGPTQTGRPCYRVTFDDGTSIVADAEHEWYTDAYRTGRPGPQRGVPREQTKQTYADHIRTTDEIRRTLTFECGGPAKVACNHSIPVAAPLRGRVRRLPIKPYTLGAWLGDGTSATAQLTCAKADFAILDRIRADGYEVGEPKFWKPSSPDTATVTLTPGVHGKRGTSVLRNALRAAELLGNKHVPAAYLRASIEQRTALLHGLMDTDGYISRAGQCEFTTTSPALRDGIVELLRSLGYKPNVKEARATVGGRDVGAKWRVAFFAYADRPCFHLQRKAARLKPAPTYRARSTRRQVVAVEPVESRPVRCIQVDSPSRLYLAGLGMVPTHNSLLVAGLALYLSLEDGEQGPEVYCAAAKRDQAKIIWNDCVTQLKRIDPEELRAERFQHSVVLPGGGFLKPISADAGSEDGMNPSAGLIDELHRQPDDSLVNVVRLSTAARAQPMVIYLTTADEDRESVCNETLARAKDVRDNPGDPTRPGFDPEFLPAVFEADVKDDWTQPTTWRKANPNLGVSVAEEFLSKRCREAKENPSLLPDFLRYHLNVRARSGARKMFPDMTLWDACGAAFDPQMLFGKDCVVGVDLSSTTDLTAQVALFPETMHVLCWFWVPEEAAKKRDVRNDRIYTTWSAGGFLRLTEGNQIDESRVLDEMLLNMAPFKVREVGIDPYNSLRYTQPMMERGMPVVAVRQGWATLSEPAKYLTTLVGNVSTPGRLHLKHGGNPVLRWMAANVELDVDKKENWSMVKPRGGAKIDGIAALVTGLARVVAAPVAPKPFVPMVMHIGGDRRDE